MATTKRDLAVAACLLFGFWAWIFQWWNDGMPRGFVYPEGHAPTQIWDEDRSSVLTDG